MVKARAAVPEAIPYIDPVNVLKAIVPFEYFVSDLC